VPEALSPLMKSPVTRTRPIALIVAAAAFLTLLVSGWALAARVHAYHELTPPPNYVFQAVSKRAFNYAGKPVTVTDENAPDGLYVNIAYGDQHLRLKVTVPPRQPDLPGLEPHADWMRILRFAPLSGLTAEDLVRRMNAGEIRDRLVVVTRTPREGVDPRTWGEIWRHDWVFDFYEFQPGGGGAVGGFSHETLGFPTTRRGKPEKEEELREGTWQFQAALAVMPSGKTPSYKFTKDALKSKGWTLAAAEGSLLVMVAALVIAFAPRRAGSEQRKANNEH
jgi:hypothetical protein